VIDPAPSKLLYFVSKNDGTHEFSETYAQHVDAVDRYQRRKRRDDEGRDTGELLRRAIPRNSTARSSASRRSATRGRRVYDAMRAGRCDDPRRRRGADGGTFFLNIRAGRMTADARAAATRRSSR
jgi:hypothetical protein